MTAPSPHARGEPPPESRFEAVYAAHHRVVLAYCARRADPDDAWDAAAEVFAVAWRRLSDLPRGDETLPWLLGVARRVLSNQQRSQRRWSRLRVRAAHAGRQSPPAPDAQLVRNEEAAEVVAALGELRSTDREIIRLALWEELPRAEIAATLGIGRDAVDQRLSRAKRRLAKLLDRSTRTKGRATPKPTARGGAT